MLQKQNIIEKVLNKYGFLKATQPFGNICVYFFLSFNLSLRVD